MAINFNEIPKLMEVGDGQGGKAFSSVQETIIRNLQASSISTSMGLKANVLGDPRAGFIRVRRPEFIKTADYGDGSSPFKSISAPEVQVLINKQKCAKYEIETFDAMVVETWPQLLGMIQAGLTSSILASLNAEFYLGIKEFVDKTPAAQLILPKFSSENATPEECRKESLQWARSVASMEKTFSSYNLGIDGSQVNTVMDQFGKINRINGLTTGNAGDRAIGFLVSGGPELKEVWGCRYVVDGMINNFIPKNSSFSEDTEVDLQNYNGFIIHNESVSMPWVMNDITYVINPTNGNPRWIAKYKYGHGIIRPELVKGIVKEAIGAQAPESLFLSFVGKPEVAVGKKIIAIPVVKPIGMSEVGITVSTDDAARVTVVMKDGKVEITGVIAGTPKIKISLNGINSAEYTITVK